MGSERPNFGSEQPNSLPDFKLKFYKRQIYSFAFLGSEFFCPQPKCKCVVLVPCAAQFVVPCGI